MDGTTGESDPGAVGPGGAGFQVRPAVDRCNPCLPATPHAAMNAAYADGSVRALAGGMGPRAWWAHVTPAGGDRAD